MPFPGFEKLSAPKKTYATFFSGRMKYYETNLMESWSMLSAFA